MKATPQFSQPCRALLRLSFAERPGVDPAPLICLISEFGSTRTEDVVCRALDSILRHLVRLKGTEPDTKDARRIAAIALQIGQSGIARVATDVARTIDAADAIAYAATLARLTRCCEVALNTLWDDIQKSIP